MGYLILKTLEPAWDFSSESRTPGVTNEVSELERAQYLILQTNYLEPDKRIHTKQLLEELRLILSHTLKFEVFSLTFDKSDGSESPHKQPLKLNSQEPDVWLQPSKRRIFFRCSSLSNLEEKISMIQRTMTTNESCS